MLSANFDRFLFAYTVGSHIIIVSASIALSLILVILEFMITRKNVPEYKTMLFKLKRMFIVSFGVGTASGIVLAVELVNLFPGFMTFVSSTGAISLFYAEVSAFFLETIALVIYVYYQDVFKWKYANFGLSILVALGVIMSAVFITMVNAWMNTPNGFNKSVYLSTGKITDVNPFAPFDTVSTFNELAHVLTTTIFVGFVILGAFFAYQYIRSKDSETRFITKLGIRISGWISAVFILLAGITGGNEVISILKYQPVKYAAIELDPNPGSGFGEHLLGSIVNGRIVGSITIPGLQAFLANFEAGITKLPGLSSYPQSDWPPLFVHTSFDVMVGGGLVLGLFFFIFFIYEIFRKDMFKNRIIMYLEIAVGFFALIVYDMGWVTDEVGRQPWIIYNVMTVNQAANYSNALIVPGYLIIAFYLFLIPFTFYFFARVFKGKSATHKSTESKRIPNKQGGE